MSELSNSIALEHNKAKERFIYYLLGIDTVSIGFAIANNPIIKFQWEYLALFFSIIFLALSFISGLRAIDFQIKTMGLNKEYLDLLEKIGRDEIEKMQELIDRKFKKTMNIIQFNSLAQGYLFVSGILSYFIFIILKSVSIV